MNDSLLFANEDEASLSPSKPKPPWKILIVDDEIEVHQVTQLVLKDFIFENRKLEFHHAYNAEEAKVLLSQENNIALGIIDVVMETEYAGLDLVHHIRNVLQNKNIRLVLRTGQPGQAPEESVIRDYDINDYKNKTELTSLKMRTLLFSSLRSYRDIMVLERSREGLERILKGMSGVYKADSFSGLASAVLQQLTLLLHLKEDAFFAVSPHALAFKGEMDKLMVIAGSGEHYSQLEALQKEALPAEIRENLPRVLKHKASYFGDKNYIGYFPRGENGFSILCVGHQHPIGDLEKYLLRIFAFNVGTAFDQFNFKQDLRQSRNEIVNRLTQAIDLRSVDLAKQNSRVGKISHILAEQLNLPEETVSMMEMAATLHDIGNISIPESILNKPEKLSETEFDQIKKHPEIGYELLRDSTNPVLQMAAQISYEHHEKWDGTGYPNQLRGEEISLIGRIVAIADVYDSLRNERVYSPAWATDKILTWFHSQKGTHFDPDLVELFLAKHAEIDALYQ